MAAYSFRNFGWFASGVVVALACYMTTSQVAAERARLQAVDRAIVQAQKDIRGLETEFDARANLAQVERWNGDVLALSAPAPQQFLPGETALASLSADGVPGPQNANLLVPSGAAVAPVATASAAPAAVSPVASPAPSPARVETAQLSPVANGVQRAVARAKGPAMAMLDRKLLSDTTLGDLVKTARVEASALR